MITDNIGQAALEKRIAGKVSMEIMASWYLLENLPEQHATCSQDNGLEDQSAKFHTVALDEVLDCAVDIGLVSLSGF